MSEWQPIETAPKDGSDVQLYCKGDLVPVYGHFVSREYLEKEYGDPEHMESGWYLSFKYPFDVPEYTIEPLLWMPLPDAPKI